MTRSRASATPQFLAVLCAIFFLSGTSALVYQVLWLRMLGLVFGVTVYAASTVWASFMAGLAIGSAVAGRMADRVRRPLLWFAGVELSIAIAAAISVAGFGLLQSLVPRMAPLLEGGFGRATLVRFACAFLMLVAPTALMGATLPLIVKSSVGRRRDVGTAIGVLYGSNTAGAIAGALLAGLWSIPMLGMRATLGVAVALNVSAAVLAVVTSRVLPTAEESAGPDAAADAAFAAAPAASISRTAAMVVLATFTASGAVALAIEVVWLRAAIIIAGPTVYTVSILLAIILGGIAIGSWLITPFLTRIRRPLAVLATLEALVALALLASLPSLTTTNDVIARLPEAAKALVPDYFVPAVVGGLLVAFPTSLLMGVAFPLGLQLWTAGVNGDRGASRLGIFYSLNVCGGIAGSLAAGFLLLPLAGSRDAVVLLAGATMFFAALLIGVSRSSASARAIGIGAIAATFALAARGIGDPIGSLLAQRRPGEPVIWREEGVQTTASIHTFLRGTRRAMHLDGFHQAGDDGASRLLHYKIGTLPLALHANPHEALIVGLGGGSTAGAMSRHSRLNVDVVELSDTVVRASKFFTHVNFDVLNRPNVHLRLDDGRNFLLATKRRYDIITADTIQPVRAGSASLYSEEYFTLVRNHLNEDGLALQWFDGTEAEYKLVARTFARVFPYVTLWDNGTLMVGTRRPLTISPDTFNWKLEIPELRDALAAIDVRTFDDLARMYKAGPAEISRFVGDGPVLTDDRPILEYFLALPRNAELHLEAVRGDIRTVQPD